MLDCLRKKGKTERHETKTISPNNKLYIWLLLTAIALTWMSLTVKEHSAVFTIWTSITCGCIASIIIAWLIDVANCRQVTRKNKENREALFANLYNVFDNGLQLLVFEVAGNERCVDSKKWYVWIDLADKQTQADSELVPKYIRNLIVFFDDVAEQVFAIKNQEALLLDAGIIYQEDIQALSTILKICDSSRSIFQSKESDGDCFKHFITNCGLIRGLIGFAPSLRPINDKMIEPRLYQMYIEAEEQTHTSENIQDMPITNSEQAMNAT